MAIPKDIPTGWPADPGVTYDPGRTRQLSPAKGVGLSDLHLVPWVIQNPGQESAGNTAPAFRLVSVAGEGGFGEVWEAVQTSLGRRVALKRLSRKISHESRARSSPSLSRGAFEQEALITARIEHPSVPPVYDLGLDQDGLPILAMRYLKGRLWNQVIQEDFNTLAVPDFLARHLPVFVDVLQAVAYAHSRGILHRDLKPGQVMLGSFGETWLIDWGLSIRFGTSLPEDPVERAAWLALPSPDTAMNPAGTLAYMAPEQTEAAASGIGPWTDIYLLGGVLYQLLAGSPPRPGANSEEIFRQASRGTIVPLSDALNQRDAPPDLVSLAERCLAPERSGRPTSISQVLESIQDHLSGSSRRRESAAIVSGQISRLQTPQADYSHYSDILVEASRAHALWSSNPAVPELLETTYRRFAEAAVRNGDLVLARVHAGRLQESEGRNRLFTLIGEREKSASRERLQRRIAVAAALFLLAALSLSALVYSRAIQRERDRAEALRQLEAVARARSDSLLDFMLKDLRESLEPIGRLDVLDKVLVRSLAEIESEPENRRTDVHRYQKARALDELGQVLMARGDVDGAARIYGQSYEIKLALVEKDPGSSEWRRGVATSLHLLGLIEQTRGNSKEALEKFESALKMRKEAVPEGGPTPEQKVEEASLWLRIGAVHESAGEPQAALSAQKRGLVLMDEALAADPKNPLWQRDRAAVHSRLGDILSSMGKQEEALREYRIYEDSVAALVKDSPQDLPLLRELAVSHNSVGWAYRALGRHDEALAEIRKQQEIATRLSKQDPGNVAWRRDMAQAFAASGRVLKEAGRYKEALTDYRVATRELEEIARIDPTNRSSTRDAAVSSALMASVLLRTPGGTTEAKRALSAAVGSLERLVTEEPSNAGWQHGLASAEVWLGQALERSGGKSASLRYFSRAAARLAPFTREPAEADTRLASTRAIALILGGQEREARPLIEYLNSSGWRDPDFVEATKQMRR